MNMEIVVMVSDSMHVSNFHGQTVAGVKMLFFWVDDSSSEHVHNKKKIS